MLDFAYLAEVEQYISSGQFEDDFNNSPEDRRFEMLGFLEKLMDLSDLADASATRIIFKSGALEHLTGVKAPPVSPASPAPEVNLKNQ